MDETSFVSLLVTAGTGRLAMDGETMPLSAGDSVFLPAGNGNVRVEGDCNVLLTRVEWNYGNSAQFTANALRTAPAATAHHLRCKNAR